MGSATGAALRLSVDRHDEHLWVSLLAILGLAAAVMMAIFGLPPIDLHGPLHKFGIMDPFCGGTRAARYTAQGSFAAAWRYNPLSILIVLCGALALLRTVVGIITGQWINLRFSLSHRQRLILIDVVVLLIVALEIRQQMRADLLMAGTHVWR